MTGVDSLTAPALIGTRLGRYEIDSALSGGMGAVYRAHDVATGRAVRGARRGRARVTDPAPPED